MLFAPVVILSLLGAQEYLGGITLTGVITPPNTKTRRLVVHQHVRSINHRPPRYLRLSSPAIRELVLVFLPYGLQKSTDYSDDSGDLDDGSPELKSYLDGVVKLLPNATLTVVGLEAVYPNPDKRTVLRIAMADAWGGGGEFRTLQEHCRAIGEAQWAMEL